MEKEYKDLFVAEAKEHIDKLNQNLVLLEKEPKNQNIINEIFRSFHTLKGNSATMGFEKFSKVAHKLEDLLDLIRNEKMDITKEVMDALFVGCDTLEHGIEEINEGEGDHFDESVIFRMLNNINPQKTESNGIILSDIFQLTNEDYERIRQNNFDQTKIKRVIIEFEDNPLRCAKALSIIKRVSQSQKNSIIRTNPTETQLKEGKMDDAMEMIIKVEDQNEIEKIIASLTKIKTYKTLDLTESYHFHKKEDAKTKIIDQHKEEIKRIQDVRIDIKNLDNLMNMVGELLIYNMNLENINRKLDSKELETVTNAINLLSQDIQNEVIEERMIPLGSVFSRLPRIVRDLAKEEGKEIEFTIEGDENKLDRTVIDKITDPLIHMIRNSVDHGVETPSEREKSGKSPKGNMKLSANREKNKIIITVEDDGAGINTEKVKQVALRKGLYSPEDINRMSDEKIQQLVFNPGFSTNEKVTEISGRGVGMNVVETNVKQAGGRVFLTSKQGIGTKVRIELPLTMAIISVLLVKIENEKYAVPINNILETIKINRKDIKMIQNNETFILRNEDIPLLRLNKLLGLNNQTNQEYDTIIIAETSYKKVGLAIDSIEMQQQVLIKDLDENTKKIDGIAGGTILGDGKVCFIIDIDGLVGQDRR